MLHDIHDAPVPLHVRTINGNTTITKKAYLGDYPKPVWFHPEGGVNILSLNNVQQFYRCTMDTCDINSINIHLVDRSILRFEATGHGLYQYSLKSNQSIDTIWNLMVETSDELFHMNKNKCFNIDTVEDRADKYTKRQLKSAQQARELENIIMRPGSRKFTDVCIPYFNDCPVTTEDVSAANNIYGKNLGSLKGKQYIVLHPMLK